MEAATVLAWEAAARHVGNYSKAEERRRFLFYRNFPGNRNSAPRGRPNAYLIFISEV